MLHLVRHGAPTAQPPLLIAHGLFGSARNWGAIARALSDRGEVVAADLRNHGESGWTTRHDYPGMADDLAQVIEGALGGRADVMGHSMGGKAAMVLALSRPDLVRRLIVADIAPVASAHDQNPQFAAMRRIDPAAVTSRAEAARLMQATTPEIAAFLLQNLDLAGRRWRLNLDLLEREMPTILGFPETGAPFAGPVLFLAGERSDYILPEHRAPIAALFPQARFVTIPGAGHWLHAERPREFEGAVRAFLDEPPAGD
ncbi:MAG: alpha/beta fold hydrolase [Rubellimicrobium sp.]|nr:alpha/beta fold hydrolase [Rubellimicrobium sp.]